MRTTISLPDELGDRARRHARKNGLSLSALVARALARLLTEPAPRARGVPPFRLVVVKGTGPAPGIDLDHTSQLLVADDETTYGRRARRK
jgi:Ribbon-helix-helix protein, copG family